MNQRIIYPTDDGGVAVVIPAPDCGLSLEEIAAKVVPPFRQLEGTGQFDSDDDGNPYEIMKEVLSPRPYEIVDASTIPTDRTLRNAWRWVD